MKSTLQATPQPNHQPNFPLTDYHYQSTLEASRATVKETQRDHDIRGFWKLSTDFIGSEGRLFYAIELFPFGVIIALSAAQVITMLVAVTRFLRGY